MRVSEKHLRLLDELSADLVVMATSHIHVRRMPTEELERLRDDVLANELVRVGFGEDYEPTPYGLMLESLIDLIVDELIAREV
jgi:hypothetical protein